MGGVGVRDGGLGAEVYAVANLSTPNPANRWPLGALVGFGADPMAASSAAAGWLAP
jgi:hypothetical protein